MVSRISALFRAVAFISAVFFILTPYTLAQNFNVRTYTTDEGLSHNNVRAMVRDSSGFLWLATWDGLSRFDGHDFRNYFHSANDTSSIPFFSVFDLALDRFNNLWLLTDGREVVKYNRAMDNFTIVRRIGETTLSHVHFINTDRSGYLWITTDSLLIRCEQDLKQSRHFKVFNEAGKQMIFSDWPGYVSPLNESELWIAGAVTRKYHKSGDDRFILDDEFPVQRSTSVRFIDFDFKTWYRHYISPDGTSWLFSNLGLFRLNKSTGIFNEYHGAINDQMFSGEPVFTWGWPDDGIYLFYTSSWQLLHIPENITHMPGATYSGEPSSIWISSLTRTGVYLGLKHIIFTRDFFINKIFTDKDSAAPVVYSVAIDKYQNIFAGLRGYNHIVRFTPDGRMYDFDQLPDELSRKGMHVRSIHPVAKGLWISYFGCLLQFYNYDTGNFRNYFPSANTTRTILPYGKGVLIGTTCLLYFEPATSHTDTLWRYNGTEGIFKLYCDEEGIIWGPGAHGRLLRYDPVKKTGSVISLTTNKCNIEDVISGSDGDLWLALLGEGVCRINRKNGLFKYYTTSDGLSNNTTYNLLRDKSGYIWVSTNAGISRINPSNNKIETFGPTDGLKISEFNSGAKFETGSGEFIFGGMGGFVRFHPDSLKENKTDNRSRIILTGLEVSGSPFLPDGALNESDTIIFRKGDDDFHLTFSTSDFINSDKIIYRYRLSGVNKGWIETGHRNRNINYANLLPGWYRLKIQATDSHGSWKISKQLVLRITPKFFESLIFIIVCSLLVLLSVALAIYFYIRNMREKNMQKLDEMKLHSLRGQMNPHFIFNSLNSINYFISNNDRLSANRYIADFSRLIRSILSNMGSNFIPVGDEISSIEDYLRIEHLRFRDKFDYNFNLSAMEGKHNLEVSPGIAQPFIENAIWHGMRPLEKRKGFLSITLVPTATCIKCIIKDNGIGRSASIKKRNHYSEHKSRGISLVTERLLLTSKLNRVNYKLEITNLDDSKAETGTKVEVDIPVKIKG
jgi:hypothetical protein